jgi:hypothetical protein
MTEQKNDKTQPAAPAASSTDSKQAAKEVEAMHVGEPQPGDGGNASVQEHFDAINEQGYMGIKVDPTPNEHYTASGVNKGLPTPETDPKQAEKARAHAAKVAAGTVEPDEA